MPLNPDTAEWLVLRTHPCGKLFVQTPNSVQRLSLKEAEVSGHRFTLLQATGLAKKLGPPWQVNHQLTFVSPEEHEAWLKRGKRTNWAP
jgi:hypothetical protein